jgi:hypothetical protein
MAPIQELIVWAENRSRYPREGDVSAHDLQNAAYKALIEGVHLYTKPVCIVMSTHPHQGRR